MNEKGFGYCVHDDLDGPYSMDKIFGGLSFAARHAWEEFHPCLCYMKNYVFSHDEGDVGSEVGANDDGIDSIDELPFACGIREVESVELGDVDEYAFSIYEGNETPYDLSFGVEHSELEHLSSSEEGCSDSVFPGRMVERGPAGLDLLDKRISCVDAYIYYPPKDLDIGSRCLTIHRELIARKKNIQFYVMARGGAVIDYLGEANNLHYIFAHNRDEMLNGLKLFLSGKEEEILEVSKHISELVYDERCMA